MLVKGKKMFRTRTKDRLNPDALETVKRIAETQVRYLDEYGRTTNYKQLSELIEEKYGERIWHRNTLPFFLGFFTPICHELHIPCLAATVVQKGSGIPGPGFAPWYKEHHPEVRDIDDKVLAKELRDEALNSNEWQILLDHLDIDYHFNGRKAA